MKKVILATLLISGIFAVDAMAKPSKPVKGDVEAVKKEFKGPKGKPGEFHKLSFDEKGCFVAPEEAKGPMADVATKADENADGCVTEDELKSFMKNNRLHRRPGEGKGPDSAPETVEE